MFSDMMSIAVRDRLMNSVVLSSLQLHGVRVVNQSSLTSMICGQSCPPLVGGLSNIAMSPLMCPCLSINNRKLAGKFLEVLYPSC